MPRMQFSKDAVPLQAGTKHIVRSAVSSRWRVGCLHRTCVEIVFMDTFEETINDSSHHRKSLRSVDCAPCTVYRTDRRFNGSYAHGSHEYGSSRSPPVNPQQCRPKCFSTRFNVQRSLLKYASHELGRDKPRRSFVHWY